LQCWNTIHRIKWHFKLGAKHLVWNGNHTYFWLEGVTPLLERFPQLLGVSVLPLPRLSL
jgi:hypothetical protein